MRRLVAVLALAVVLVAGSGLAEAAFTTHESNEQTFTAGDVPGPADLVAQSRTNDGGASGSQIQYGLKLTNAGGERLDLDTVTVRYWFTVDGSPGMPVVACYYASFGCGKLQQSVTDLPKRHDGADHYAEVAFTQGRLDAGESASLDQLAIRDPGGATYNQDDDHSFLSAGSFTDNPRVTAYIDGRAGLGHRAGAASRGRVGRGAVRQLRQRPAGQRHQAGAEGPQHRHRAHRPQPPDPALLVHRRAAEADAGFLRLRGARVREGHHPLRNVSSRRGPERTPTSRSASASGTLQAGGNSGQIQLRVHGSDFCAVRRDETTTAVARTPSFASTMKVAAYLDGTLVWGNPAVSADVSAADRLRWLGRTASMWILAIVLLVVAALVGASWTLGAFSSSTPNPKNTVSAGSMSQDNSADDEAIMGASDLLPGDRVEGSATIENVGDARGEFTLRVKDVDDDPGPNGGDLSSYLRAQGLRGGPDRAHLVGPPG